MRNGIALLAGIAIGAMLASYITADRMAALVNRLPFRKRAWIAWCVLRGKLKVEV